jgi:hypothetical protein
MFPELSLVDLDDAYVKKSMPTPLVSSAALPLGIKGFIFLSYSSKSDIIPSTFSTF